MPCNGELVRLEERGWLDVTDDNSPLEMVECQEQTSGCMGNFTLSNRSGVSLSDHFIFRRGFGGYKVEDYTNPSALPPGIASTVAICFGIMGTVLGMSQVRLGKLQAVSRSGAGSKSRREVLANLALRSRVGVTSGTWKHGSWGS
ncbi:hypothetical protein V8F20_011122 [Naviculisporaceae sp. PSN 640]